MSSEENKALIRRVVDGLNKREAGLIEKVYAPNYSGYDPDRPQPRTIGEMQQIFTVVLGQVFPDGHYTTEDLFAEGDKVLWHWTFSATYKGGLMGIPSTDQHVSFKGVNIFRIADNKIVEDWVYRDTVGMFRQLGVTFTGAS